MSGAVFRPHGWSPELGHAESRAKQEGMTVSEAGSLRIVPSQTGSTVSGPSKTVRLTTSVWAKWGPWAAPLGAWKKVPA